jgi:serine/threonine protein phosphatase PrpC
MPISRSMSERSALFSDISLTMQSSEPLHNDLPNGRALTYQDNSCHGEDAFVTRELNRHIALDAVLDGATGRGGCVASTYAADILRKATVESVDDLTTLLDYANRELFRRGKGRFFLTTVSVALKIGRELHVLSVGDSPVLLIRGGDIVALSPTAKGHTFLGVANALGRYETLSYKAAWTPLQAQDRLVLVTDGIIENVAPSELAALTDDARSPEEAVSTLQQLLCRKKHEHKGRVDERSGFRRDDATAIIRYIGLNSQPEA